MVDSRNFKKQNNNSRMEGLKKHKWIPFVVIVVLAVLLILMCSFLIDINNEVWSSMDSSTSLTNLLK